MTFLEELLNSLKKRQSSPALATPPFVPGQTQDFASAPFPSAVPQGNGLPPRNRSDLATRSPTPAPTPAPQMPQLSEVTVPDRQLSAGVLQGVSAPDRERVSGMIDQPWYKDKDTMEDLGARLSQAFGGLTMRGNSAAETAANMKRMQGAAANKQKNKTMDYLIKNNPEMAKVLMGVPEEYRGQTLEKLYGLQTGGSDPASVKEWKFRESLTPEQRAEFDRTQARGSMVKGPDGSMGYYDNAGTFTPIITSEMANLMTAQSTDAAAGATATNEDFNRAYRGARYADDNISGMQSQIKRLEQFPDRGGIFQPLKQTISRIQAEFGGADGLAKATAEQLNESDNIRRTMQWFQDSGLGARGLDTPAEFMNWLKMNGGDLSMTNDASIAFLKRAISDQVRNAGRYNEMLTSDVYQSVGNRGDYPSFDVTDPYAIPAEGDGGGSGATKVVGGVTYYQGPDGQWYTE